MNFVAGLWFVGIPDILLESICTVHAKNWSVEA